MLTSSSVSSYYFWFARARLVWRDLKNSLNAVEIDALEPTEIEVRPTGQEVDDILTVCQSLACRLKEKIVELAELDSDNLKCWFFGVPLDEAIGAERVSSRVFGI